MRKVKLEVETLSVDSFETGAAQRAAGTVLAHNHTRGNHVTCDASCAAGGDSCDCDITVYETCLEPCGTTLC